MIPVTYPSSVSTSKESQMVVFALSSVAGLQRWTDYIPVKYQSTGSDVPNSFNTNGYIACDFVTNTIGRQAWVDYVPVFVDNLATTAWQVSDTGFIPFNTLAGGGAYVALYLDFINSTSLDSRITFSRGTNATLTDSNGRVAYAPHNLLTNSEDFEAAAWVKSTGTITSNATTAPDGTTTADKLINATTASNVRYITQTVASSIGVFSVYAKAAEESVISLWLVSASVGAVFNLANGTFTLNGVTSAQITPEANGWYRCTVYHNTATTTAHIYLRNGSAYTPSNASDGVFLWGAQLNVGALQSYNSTTPKNLLGFTQEPENAAWTKSNSYVQQNLLTWSQDFSNTTAWPPTNITVTNAATTAPDGTNTAQSIASTTTAATLLVSAVATVLATSATYSIYVKQGTGASAANTFIFRNGTTATNLLAGTLNYSTGVFTYTIGSTGVSVQNVGNGWWRLIMTVTSGVTSGDGLRVYVGFSGASETAGTFLYAWGAQLVQGSTAGDYTQTTSAAAPTRYVNWDGTLTGRKLVENTATADHFTSQALAATWVTGAPITGSAYFKQGERRYARVFLSGATSGWNAYCAFDLQAGTAGTALANSATATASIVNAGGGWYRCTVTAVPSVTSTAQLTLNCGINNSLNANDSSYTGDGTSGIYVSDFQLSNSASVDPYVYNPQAAAASTAYYGPRFDYDPVTLAAKGLLIEEQRTNLIQYSEYFDNSAWVKGNGTVTANSAVAPDGSTSADTLIENTANSTHFLYQTIARTAGVATYTCSVFLKSTGASRYVRIMISDATTSNYSAAFVDPVSGTIVGSVVNVGFTAGSFTVTPAGNGWYRGVITATTDVASTGITGQVYLATTSSVTSYTGDGTSGIYLWGAQLEAGSFATSYIPTVASQVTRNADSASMLGDNFYTWFNQSQGTFSADADTLYSNAADSATIRAVFAADDGTYNNLHRIYQYQNKYGGNTVVAGANQSDISLSTVAANTPAKTAYAYAVNSFAAAMNGVLGTLDTSGTLPAPNRLSFGVLWSVNGHIRRIGYYNTRLPDSTLQALTS